MQLRFHEPTLRELLNDPIIRLVMKADDVTSNDILALFDVGQDLPTDSPPAYICSRLLEAACRREA